MSIPSIQDWRKYVPGLAGTEHVPSLKIAQVEWQTYDVQTSLGPVRTQSMLTILELALLYGIARDFYSGAGEIVDAGPLLGVGTRALAQGLTENHRVRDKLQRIWSFDLWLTEGMGHYVAGLGDQTGSVFHAFQSLTEDYTPQIHASPGDLLKMSWQAKPIEILFIDISKSLELNAYIVKNWFTQLIAGTSIVVQQDYVYFDQWWIAVTMEYFKEHFELLGFVFGATAYYLCTRSIPMEKIGEFLALSRKEHLALLDAAIAGAPPSVAQVLQCGKARLLMTFDRVAAAAALREVRRNVRSPDPVSDFSEIAAGNAEIMAKLLA